MNENLTLKAKDEEMVKAFASEGLTVDDISKLRDQCKTEHKIATDYVYPKRQSWLNLYKLYNNQKRDPKDVGDPLLFTVHQTVLAALYNDSLTVNWAGKEEGDDPIADNLNDLAEYDYDVMEKSLVDYYWDWDVCFYGIGYVNMTNFNREKSIMAPSPELVDPASVLVDPNALLINGIGADRYRAASYFGREIRNSRLALKQNPSYKNLERLKGKNNDQSDILKEISQARASAMNLNYDDTWASKNDNETFDLIEWNTNFKGNKVICTWDVEFKTLVRYQVVGKPNEDWWLVDRSLYPASSDFFGSKIADFTEDKQRARAIVQNLILRGAKQGVQPRMMYDASKIKDPRQLDHKIGKHIAVDGPVSDGIIRPVVEANASLQVANYILQTLDTASQKATATPEIQQGTLSTQERTLGELEMVASKVDTRHSLAAKLWGISEKTFWKLWYRGYKKHFKAHIDEKIARISGAYGNQWRVFTRENIIAAQDPDVIIESVAVTEGKRMRQRAELMNILTVIAQDPSSNMRYGFKKLLKLYGFKKDEMDRLLPPTIDEILAEEENLKLSENKIDEVRVLANDNHVVHMELHAVAAETPAKQAHMEAHKKAMLLKRDSPELFPGQEEGMLPGQERDVEQTQTPQELLTRLAPRRDIPRTYTGGPNA